MSDGYYDPYPRIVLDEPLGLVGHAGAEVTAIAHAVCARTGLPFNDVARSAETLAGASLTRVLVEQGREAQSRVETRALREALRRQPAGLVVFESHLLDDSAITNWLPQACRIVYVRRPVDELLRRLRVRLQNAPGSVPEFVAAAPPDAEALSEHLAAREANLTLAHVILDAGSRPAMRVADELLASLDRLGGSAL